MTVTQMRLFKINHYPWEKYTFPLRLRTPVSASMPVTGIKYFPVTYGMKVDSAGSGEEAINILREKAALFDLVFMDYMMPKTAVQSAAKTETSFSIIEGIMFYRTLCCKQALNTLVIMLPRWQGGNCSSPTLRSPKNNVGPTWLLWV